MKTMEDAVSGINAIIATMQDDMAKAVAGNKTAAQRSRKTSLELEKRLKEWRKISVSK